MAAATDHGARAHAKLSASGSHAWLVCTMKPTMEEGLPDSSNVYSDAGTWGHERNDILLREWLAVSTPEDAEQQMAAHLASEVIGQDWKDKMIDLSDQCVEWAKRKIAKLREEHGHENVTVIVEQRVDFSDFVPEGFGSCDLCILVPGRAYVIDWKLGRGEVRAADNSQLMLYALGFTLMFQALFDFADVEMHIVQPMIGNFDHAEISAAELMAWAETIKPIAAVAFTGEGAEFVPDVTGETGQCQWCKVKNTCKARAEAIEASAAGAQDPALMSDSELARLYPRMESLIEWATGVRDFVQSKVLAGHKGMGLKVVAGRSTRQITDAEKARKLLTEAGFELAVITEAPPVERPLLGLGALEKVVGKKQLPLLLSDVLVKSPGKPTVVSEADPREAIEIGKPDADAAFEGLE